MNSQILSKLNSFTKKRLFELAGILLIVSNLFLIASIFTYSPSDPNFIYTPENTEIKNIGGFYGSVISDLILQSIGLVSFLIPINIFFWGYGFIAKKGDFIFSNPNLLRNILIKIFYIQCYIVCGTVVLSTSFNDSYWLVDNGNGGFVGKTLSESFFDSNNSFQDN